MNSIDPERPAEREDFLLSSRFEDMKDPLRWMVAAAMVGVFGVLACGTIVTMHEHETAVQNNQTDAARHH